MAKQGQHNKDSDDKDVSEGRNNPSKSVDETAGTPKNQETYHQQAAQHQDTSESHARGGGGNLANRDSDTREKPDQTMIEEPGRTGSESNAS